VAAKPSGAAQWRGIAELLNHRTTELPNYRTAESTKSPDH